MAPHSIDADHVIVGGGQSGFYALTAIRRRDTSGRVVLVCDEPHLPYDRVPLSKDYLVDKRPREKLFFRPKEFYENQKVEVISGKRATRLDKSGRVLKLEDDTEIAFKRLLLATGGRPRVLALPGSNLAGIHYLRTIDDCERIKEGMKKARSAVVVGGGFIGCEVAASFATRGLRTTMVEVASYPLNVAVNEETGRWIARYFRERGVDVITDTQVSAFVGRDGAVEAVRTSRGELPADLVAVGVGIAPNIELAQEAGLKVDRGIVVDEYLQTDSEGVYAAGDVARFYSPIFERHLRVEHYDVAAKQGMTAGANMAGERKAFADLPFFFSFMFDLKINAYGDLSKKTRIVSRGPVGAEKGFFQLYFDDGVLNGFLSVNRPFQEVNELKRVILSRKSFPDVSPFQNESWSLGALILA
jgi:3-phenylpropionate/trans-cinnamate dioxygenase ferredoxin reductase subunit